MNSYKMSCLVEFIRRYMKLPTDFFGQTLCPDDIIAWYGFDRILFTEERAYLKQILSAMTEIETAIDQLKT
jgi:hypothetical protein